MIFENIASIGFGEAGPVFIRGFRDSGARQARAYDIAYGPETREAFEAKAFLAGAEMRTTPAEAVAGADLIVSTVTADQTEIAARAVAPYLGQGQVYLDLNSCSPRQKIAAANHVQKQGAVFVEGVAMDTVPATGFQVPLLLAGPQAAEVARRLTAHGMVVEAVGESYGSACSIKLIRSVLIKGLEALFAEAVTAASKLGVEDRVIGTLYKTYPGVDWRKVAGYHLSRLAIHGQRRAAEMRESATTLSDLGVEPIMASAIAARQDWGVSLELKKEYLEMKGKEPTISDFVEALSRRAKAAG